MSGETPQGSALPYPGHLFSLTQYCGMLQRHYSPSGSGMSPQSQVPEGDL